MNSKTRDFHLNTDNESRRDRWLAVSETKDINLKDLCSPSRHQTELSESIRDQIHRDLHRSWTNDSLTEEQITQLNTVLCAYAIHNPEIAYCQGINFLAAVCLHVCKYNPTQALQILIHIIDKFAVEYFTVGLVGIQTDLAVLFTLMTEHLPDVANAFITASVPIDFCCTDTIMVLFVHKLPLNTLLVLWDLLLTSKSSTILFGALLHFFDLHKASIIANRLDSGQLMDDLKNAVVQFSEEATAFDVLTGTLAWSSKLNDAVISNLRTEQRRLKLQSETQRKLRMKSWETTRGSEIMLQVLAASKLRTSLLVATTKLQDEHSNLFPSTSRLRKTICQNGRSSIQALEKWMVHLSKKVEAVENASVSLGTAPWEDAMNWEARRLETEECKKEQDATIDQKMLRWVKKTSALLQNSVREQQDESNTTVSDINSNSDSNSLHAKVKRVETEESILNQIVTDTDMAMVAALRIIKFPQHINASIESFRSSLLHSMASIPTLIWVDSLVSTLENNTNLDRKARPYIAALTLMTKLDQENRKIGFLQRLPNDERHLFSEAINSLNMQLRNWLQHNMNVTQHRAFENHFQNCMNEWNQNNDPHCSLLCCLPTKGDQEKNMLQFCRRNSTVLRQICGHVNQAIGIRFKTLHTLCEHMEKQQYIHASREEKSRRTIDAVMNICEMADTLLAKIDKANTENNGDTHHEAVVVHRNTAVRAPVLMEGRGETKQVMTAEVLVSAIAQAPIIDSEHMRMLGEIKMCLRDLERAKECAGMMMDKTWSDKLIGLIDRTVIRVMEGKANM